MAKNQATRKRTVNSIPKIVVEAKTSVAELSIEENPLNTLSTSVNYIFSPNYVNIV